jgi:hypothetical protein
MQSKLGRCSAWGQGCWICLDTEMLLVGLHQRYTGIVDIHIVVTLILLTCLV